MKNIYPLGTALTFVWRFQNPDGSPIVFVPTRFHFALRYTSGRGEKYIETFAVNPEGDGITWTLPAKDQHFLGPYDLVLDIYLDGRLIEHYYYRKAFTLYQSAKGTINTGQYQESATVNLLSVGEFYHFMTGEVINTPDEEDITSDSRNLLKFKDRDGSDGMGYVIVRKGIGKSFAEQVIYENTIYEIRYDFDLDDGSVTIPDNCVLKFDGGSLSNGTIIGDNTDIVSKETEIFDNVRIQGDWKVETIYSDWFKNYESYDVIRDVFNLTSDTHYNKVVINDKGIWYLTITVFDYETGSLYIKSDTHIQLDGTLKLNTTGNSGYYMIQIKSDNVSISGSGSIIGKSDGWTSGGGQTGMGIGIVGADNIVIEGITIEYHRGDAIRVGGIVVDEQPKPSKNVVIQNCVIRYAHENGIAVTGAENVLVQDCYISDVTLSSNGAGPAAAIDVENSNEGVPIYNIAIENVMARNCNRGLSIYDDSELGVVRGVRASNYRAENCINMGLRLGYNISSVNLVNSYFSAVGDVLNAFALYDDAEHEFSQLSLQYNVILENCTFHKLAGDERDSPQIAVIRHPNISMKTCKFVSDANNGVENYGHFVIRDNRNIPTYVEDTQITCRYIIIEKPIHLKNSIVHCISLQDSAEGSIYENNIIECDNTAKTLRSFVFSGSGLMMKGNVVRAFLDIACSGNITDNDFAAPEGIRAGRYATLDDDHSIAALLTLGPKETHEYTVLSRNMFHCDDIVEGYTPACVYVTQRPLEESGPDVGFDYGVVSDNIIYLRNVANGISSPVAYIYENISVINNTGIANIEDPDSGASYRLAGDLYCNLYRTKSDTKDYFKGVARFSLRDRGFTSERPSFTNGGDAKQYTGFAYFDTTLGSPIWWDGADWVDATGTSV